MVKTSKQQIVEALSAWTSNGKHLTKGKSVVQAVVKTYRENGNGLNAAQMSKYMRNQFEFFGLKSPERRKLDKEILVNFSENDLTREDLFCIATLCWKEPEREVQYFGMELLTRNLNILAQPQSESHDAMELLKYLIATKSWWDTVDLLASNAVGHIVQRESEYALSVVEEWIKSENMWLRRTAILHQLKYKKLTDEKRLFRYCTLCCHEKEFFIQKAIGWALREYAKTNSKSVKKYVKTNEKKLANLSKREALKHVGY